MARARIVEPAVLNLTVDTAPLPPAEPGVTLPQRLLDRGLRGAVFALAGVVVLVVLAIVYEVMRHALPAIGEWGIGFLTHSAWDPSRGAFGVLSEILGTLYTSLLALGLGGVLGITVALVTSQRFLSPRFELLLKNVIELLAAIPSVVYGLWGIFVLIPFVRGPATWLHEQFGFLPIFDTAFKGPGVLPASLVLAIMILPTVTAVSREALAAVPERLGAAAYGLGATQWEVIWTVTLPTAAGGVFGSLVLGFGRALGETMALAMLIGNAREFGWSLLSPGTTIAALLANHFPEAGQVEVRALMYAALVLLVITLTVNAAGTWIMLRTTRSLRGLG
jgi:phosphate transport system permease protein